MDLRISKLGVALLLVVTALAVGLFAYLVPRFGGPQLRLPEEQYRVKATFPDVLGLEKSGDVWVRGVKIGTVRGVKVRGDDATVELAIEDEHAPLGRDATIRIGQKTPLGESYVDLLPGDPRRAGALRSGGAIRGVQRTVTPSQALRALDGPARRDVRSLLSTFAAGAEDPDTSRRVHDTLTGTAELVAGLRSVSETLRRQDRDVAGLVTSARTSVGALGSRERSIRRVVSGGAATLHALAAQRVSLHALLDRLPRLMETARGTLAVARPLLVEARPAVADLRRASPRLTPALKRLGPVSSDADAVLTRLRPFNAVALPLLRKALPTVDVARPVVRSGTRALGELIPVARYAEPRKAAITGWFSGTIGATSRGDERGPWHRFNIFVDPATAFGLQGQVEYNAFTKPGDALGNRPYRRGDFERLMPHIPGDR